MIASSLAAAVPGQLVRRRDVAAVHRHPDPDQPDHAKDIADEAVGEVDAAFEEGMLGIGAEDQGQVVIEGQQQRHQREHQEAASRCSRA